jgi:hypothetical protein
MMMMMREEKSIMSVDSPDLIPHSHLDASYIEIDIHVDLLPLLESVNLEPRLR